MKEIKLTRGFKALVDDDDFIILRHYNWQVQIHPEGMHYARGVVNGRIISMHRFILEASSKIKVDHRDRNGLNNQRYNLRICNHMQNTWNQVVRVTNKLGIKGVSMRGKRFVAQIQVNGKKIHLGYHSTAENAGEVYKNASLKYFGEFSGV